jgi:hypothetical protein
MMEKTLIVILRISGAMLITAFFAVIMPFNMMAQIHQLVGLGQLPSFPIIDYLARSLSLFYVMHGVIVIYISFNLLRYLQFLKLLCYLGFGFGLALFIIDLHAPMPGYWTTFEGPFVILLNLLVYILALRIQNK